MSIICGTDFSPGADVAARTAARLARRLGKRLYVVHVTPLATHSVDGVTGIERQLDLLAHELSAETGVEVQGLVRSGDVSERLAALAVELHADVVVVAALSHAGHRSHWLTGSTAERVAQRSPVPALIVREGGAIERWAAGEGPLRVLVAMEPDSPVGRSALRWAIQLGRLGACELNVLQVAWPFGEHVRLGVPPPVALDRLHPEIVRVLERDLARCVHELGGPTSTKILATHGLGRTEFVIADQAMRHGCDLVVVGTHQRATVSRLWQGSVSRGVLHIAACNVVCVPRDRAEEMAAPPTYRRVVVATDFSPLANRALPFARALVNDGTVHLVTVVHGASPAEREALRQKLLVLAGPASSCTVEVVSQADVPAGICAAAERGGADAICMATHGHTGVVRLALGSQAQAVVERSRLPVLLVPPPREE